MKKGMFAYRNGMTYSGYDKTCFIEMTNSCKFNCVGCNILKNIEKKIEISVKEFEYIVKFLNIFMNEQKYCIGLGTGDFANVVTPENLKKYIETGLKINSDITLSIGGNYSTDILEKEKLDIMKKYYDNITLGIILNPLMEEKNKQILFENLNKLAKIFDFRDVSIFLNLSKSYFLNKETINLIKNILLDIAKIGNLEKVESLTLVFSPNKSLLRKEEFQIDLKTETDWLIEFWKRKDEFVKNITYENIVKNYFFYKDIRILPHFIDKNLNFYISLEHIGDMPLNQFTGFNKLVNIKKLFESYTNEELLYEKIKQLSKEINLFRYKVLINNKKKLLSNDLCKNCKYLELCSKQSVPIQREIYKETMLGQEISEYCLGHKKLNDFILNNLMFDNSKAVI
jgi:hypothetical protein